MLHSASKILLLWENACHQTINVGNKIKVKKNREIQLDNNRYSSFKFGTSHLSIGICLDPLK